MKIIRARRVVFSCLACWAASYLLLLVSPNVIGNSTAMSDVALFQSVLFMVAGILTAVSVILMIIKLAESTKSQSATPAKVLAGSLHTAVKGAEEKETKHGN